MEGNSYRWLRDYAGRRVRLTEERWSHILEHPEMRGQARKIQTTLREPEVVVTSRVDPSVHLYFRPYQRSPVGKKYLMVAVKLSDTDAFVVTAFFIDQPRGGS